MTEKRMPAAERRRETTTAGPALQLVVVDNRPDTGLLARLERALTRSGEPVQRKMTMAPEPKDKLDAATATARRFCPPASPWGLLEPDAPKGARPVLRGARRSDAPGLPGEERKPPLMPRHVVASLGGMLERGAGTGR